MNITMHLTYRISDLSPEYASKTVSNAFANSLEQYILSIYRKMELGTAPRESYTSNATC